MIKGLENVKSALLYLFYKKTSPGCRLGLRTFSYIISEPRGVSNCAITHLIFSFPFSRNHTNKILSLFSRNRAHILLPFSRNHGHKRGLFTPSRTEVDSRSHVIYFPFSHNCTTRKSHLRNHAHPLRGFISEVASRL